MRSIIVYEANATSWVLTGYRRRRIGISTRQNNYVVLLWGAKLVYPEEQTAMGSSEITQILKDNGGRRSGNDRRSSKTHISILEMRSGIDRRNGKDRRHGVTQNNPFHSRRWMDKEEKKEAIKAVQRQKRNKRLFFRLIFCSLLCALISMVVIFIVWHETLDGISTFLFIDADRSDPAKEKREMRDIFWKSAGGRTS